MYRVPNEISELLTLYIEDVAYSVLTCMEFSCEENLKKDIVLDPDCTLGTRT
jgi:hypothetical protein